MSIDGKWRITKMDLWDDEAIDLLGPAFIEFKGQGGQFRFIAVEGRMDCRHGQRNDRPSIDFTWEGNDECDPASGRGWVTLQQDGSLSRFQVRGLAKPRISRALGGIDSQSTTR